MMKEIVLVTEGATMLTIKASTQKEVDAATLHPNVADVAKWAI